MKARNLVLAALFIGALAFGGVAGAQQPADDAGGAGGGRGNRPGRGQRTPEEMQQRREERQKRYDERMKKAFQMTDIEWLTLDQKIQKVQAIQREIDMASGSNPGARFGQGAFGGMGGMGNAMDPNAPGPAFQEPQTESGKAMQELQTTLNDQDATPEQITAKLQALRDARAKLPEELAAARADLLKGLTPRQEAQLVVMGVIQ